MDVAVHPLSVCTLSSRAALDTLHDEPVREDRRADFPSRTQPEDFGVEFLHFLF